MKNESLDLFSGSRPTTQGGGGRYVQCNKSDNEDEEESPGDNDRTERPTESPTSPPAPYEQSGAPRTGCNFFDGHPVGF
ncbi:hypothetical protein WME91_37820 [Sorangium sp. So ce269]